MANEKNLIPQAHRLTVEEQSRAGIASGKARREKKLLKTIAQAMLDAPIQDDYFIEHAMSLYPGLEKEQITQSFAMLSDVIEILRKRKKVPAKDEDGKEIKDENGKRIMESKPAYKAADRLKAYQILEATSGQKPVEQTIVAFDENNELIIDLGEEDEKDIEENGTESTEND
jgi:hypothetical protein